MKNTGCVLLGDHQGGRISVHQSGNCLVIVIILDYGDFVNRSQFTLPVMIIGSKSKWSKNMVEAALVWMSVVSYC